MSGDNLVTDDDSELRDMVANLLERNGTLAKIRAQLRASVFLALDEKEDALVNQPLMNHQMKNFLNTDYGRQCVSLVWEFLEFFNLDYTLSVFMRESYALTSSPGDNPDSDKVYNGRDHLKRKLGINQESNVPLLGEVLHSFMKSQKAPVVPEKKNEASLTASLEKVEVPPRRMLESLPPLTGVRPPVVHSPNGRNESEKSFEDEKENESTIEGEDPPRILSEHDAVDEDNQDPVSTKDAGETDNSIVEEIEEDLSVSDLLHSDHPAEEDLLTSVHSVSGSEGDHNPNVYLERA